VEVIAPVAVLIRPFRPCCWPFCIWKMGSEFIYPHYELFEWIERGRKDMGSLLRCGSSPREGGPSYLSLQP